MKKLIPFLIILLIVFIGAVLYSLPKKNQNSEQIVNSSKQSSQSKNSFTNSVSSETNDTTSTNRQSYIPKEYSTSDVEKTKDSALSQAEKNKIISSLPIRIENFQTSQNIKTTINIFSSTYDPQSSLHIEIYNVNFNEPLIDGANAIAFKESFIEAKKRLEQKKVNTSNLQIIYGNRQYIQDTAQYWVKEFKLAN